MPLRLALTLAGLTVAATGAVVMPAPAGASVPAPGAATTSLAQAQARAGAVDLQIAALANRTQAAQAAALGADLAETRLESAEA
ncbi:MAG: hypothetical protein ACYCSJ_10230, partial [Acidimicrobiales bacterium]